MTGTRQSPEWRVYAIIGVSIVIAALLFDILFPNARSRSAARQELLRLHGELHVGLASEAVDRIFLQSGFRHLKRREISNNRWVKSHITSLAI